MIILERRERILDILEKQRTSTVRDLAKALYISEASIRRDLESLEKAGLVRRIYGGVVLEKYKNGVIPLQMRDGDHSAAKDELARQAAELVNDGDTLMLDASSTVRRMIRYLKDKNDLKIITNNLVIFNEWQGSGQLYCTGGQYNEKNAAFFGQSAENYLQSLHADWCFFSSQGLSLDGEISDASEAETSLRQVMLARSRHQVFLCDASKVGVRQMFTLCHKDDVSHILCNAPLPWEG